MVKETSKNVYDRWTVPELWRSWAGDAAVSDAVAERAQREMRRALETRIIWRQDADTPKNTSMPNTPCGFFSETNRPVTIPGHLEPNSKTSSESDDSNGSYVASEVGDQEMALQFQRHIYISKN